MEQCFCDCWCRNVWCCSLGLFVCFCFGNMKLKMYEIELVLRFFLMLKTYIARVKLCFGNFNCLSRIQRSFNNLVSKTICPMSIKVTPLAGIGSFSQIKMLSKSIKLPTDSWQSGHLFWKQLISFSHCFSLFKTIFLQFFSFSFCQAYSSLQHYITKQIQGIVRISIFSWLTHFTLLNFAKKSLESSNVFQGKSDLTTDTEIALRDKWSPFNCSKSVPSKIFWNQDI